MFRYLNTYIGSLKGIFSTVKKLLLVLTVFTFIIVVFYHAISGNRIKLNDEPYKNTQAQIYSTINDKKLLSTKGGRANIMVYRGYLCVLFGEACTDKPKTATSKVGNGIFGYVTGLMVMPFSAPPASSIAWINSGLEKAGFVPKSYAAEGIGFASMKGYIALWTIFRDISYMILVIVMVVIGFLIMFRSKMGSQNAMTIEAALPRIVLAMILITFSFAIAGLLIDLMYLFILLIINIVYSINIGTYTPDNVKSYQDAVLSSDMARLWPDSGGSGYSTFVTLGYRFYGLIPMWSKSLLFGLIFIPFSAMITGALTKIGETFAEGTTGIEIMIATLGAGLGKVTLWPFGLGKLAIFTGLFYALPGLVLGLIITFTLLLFIFKIFFILVTSYIKIILYIVFAPIMLLFEAIPGNSVFSWWLKNMAGELIAFPTVVALQVVSGALLASNTVNPSTVLRFPYLTGFLPDQFSAIISLGLVLMTPDLIKLMKKWLGATDMGINFGIGSFFAGGGAIMGGAMGLQGNLQSMRNLLIGHDPWHRSTGLFGTRDKKEGQKGNVLEELIKKTGF